MSYYLKIHYNNKIKKFIVHNPKQISTVQIKNIFYPPIPSNINISFHISY
jgi:hypothetical protein